MQLSDLPTEPLKNELFSHLSPQSYLHLFPSVCKRNQTQLQHGYRSLFGCQIFLTLYIRAEREGSLLPPRPPGIFDSG